MVFVLLASVFTLIGASAIYFYILVLLYNRRTILMGNIPHYKLVECVLYAGFSRFRPTTSNVGRTTTITTENEDKSQQNPQVSFVAPPLGERKDEASEDVSESILNSAEVEHYI